MEASAFLQLCGCFPGIASLGVVKGVLDYGDKHKTSDNRTAFSLTLTHTAEALKGWIAHNVPEITWDPDYYISAPPQPHTLQKNSSGLT